MDREAEDAHQREQEQAARAMRRPCRIGLSEELSLAAWLDERAAKEAARKLQAAPQDEDKDSAPLV